MFRVTWRANSMKPARLIDNPSPAFGKPSNIASNSWRVSSSSSSSSDTSLHLHGKADITKGDVGNPGRSGEEGDGGGRGGGFGRMVFQQLDSGLNIASKPRLDTLLDLVA